LAVKTSPTPKLNILDFLSRSRQVGIVFFIVILIIGVSLRSPYFLTLDNFRDILLDISILIIVSLAQSMVIIARGFDLSVASMIALTAMMIGFVDKQFPATPVVVLVLLSIALGGVLGGINGLIVTLGRVPPIIATLGTLSVYRGLVFLYSTGTWINPFELAQPFKELSKATPLGLPNLVIFAFIIALIAYYFLNYTHAGRNIYTYGSNPEAAKVAGLNTQNIVFMVFVISGIACGLAGVLWASRFEAAQTNTAAGFELQSIAASVVGGVSVLGGSGSVVGVVLGALLLGIINNALTLIRISPFWQLAVQGLLILAAVIIDSVVLVRLHSAKK
jgi:rhamnose transport system permease protein